VADTKKTYVTTTAKAYKMTQKFTDIAGGLYIPAEANNIFDSTRQYAFSLDSCAQALTYNADNTLAYIIAGPDHQGNLYKQSMTYTSGNCTAISAWVKQ
jgi:hypothetical protein